MNLTASGLWRAEPCPASVVLPWVKREYADAERGRKEHAALEASPPPGGIVEVAFAFDVLTARAREVGRSIGRDYGKLAEGEIPGTTDLVELEPDHILVTDYKTGHGYMQAPPPINPQLQHAAICAATVYDRPRAIVQLIYTRTGEVKDAEFDLFDFESIKERLRSIWTRCKAAEVVVATEGASALVGSDLVAEGDCCWRCPATKSCPLKGKKR